MRRNWCPLTGPKGALIVSYSPPLATYPLGIHQHQHDQHTAKATVAVRKRVDGLQLDMGQGSFDQNGQVVFGMDEPLKIGDAIRHLFRWWGNKVRVSRTRSANPVLAAPELSRNLIRAPTTGQQHPMHLPQKPGR